MENMHKIKKQDIIQIIKTCNNIKELLFMIKDYIEDGRGYYGLWHDLIKEHFYPSNIDDVTDIDNEKVL